MIAVVSTDPRRPRRDLPHQPRLRQGPAASRPCRLLLAAAVVLSLVAVAACSSPVRGTSAQSGRVSTPTDTPKPAPASPTAGSTVRQPVTTKVLTVVIENHSVRQMQSAMPYLNSLAKRYGYATDYRAVQHPSLPNYLAIAFGTTAGVHDDKPPAQHHVRGDSIFSLAEQAGTGARLYAESMPSRCQKTSAYPYAVRHNPWAYGSAGCATGDVPAGTPRSGRLHDDARAGRLPCAGMMIPNVLSDAHDRSLARADRYLKTWLPGLMAGPDFRSGRLAIVVTADEDDRSSAENRVLTVVISRSVRHVVVRKTLTHYSLTRLYNTVCQEKSYLGKAATAPSMQTAFGLRTS
jgi:hypothetical protein